MKGEGFFIAFYNDDSTVPSITNNRYHAIVMIYTETNFPNPFESRLGVFVMVFIIKEKR